MRSRVKMKSCLLGESGGAMLSFVLEVPRGGVSVSVKYQFSVWVWG